jgi:imidazolonepropionase-like amidohydrolase
MKTATGTTVISNGRIVDGTGEGVTIDGALVIENGRITFVGKAVDLPSVSDDAERIDAGGGTIMPG